MNDAAYKGPRDPINAPCNQPDKPFPKIGRLANGEPGYVVTKSPMQPQEHYPHGFPDESERDDQQPREWECPECKTRYTKNVGKCGDLTGCSRPSVIPVSDQLDKHDKEVREKIRNEVATQEWHKGWAAAVEANEKNKERLIAEVRRPLVDALKRLRDGKFITPNGHGYIGCSTQTERVIVEICADALEKEGE